MKDFTQLRTSVLDVITRETPFGDRTVIKMPRAVMVIAFDTEGKVHFLQEYMAPQRAFNNTFAKGAIDARESPEAAARRELAEELGLTADRLERLLELKNQPSHSTAETVVFVAYGCTPHDQPAKGDEVKGSIHSVSMPWHDLFTKRKEIFSCARCLAATGELIAQNIHRKSDQ